jgi:hypothetical protein
MENHPPVPPPATGLLHMVVYVVASAVETNTNCLECANDN